MALFPQQFIDDLKHHADIVVVIQDYVSLKKTGRDLQRAVSVSRREDAVVPRQPRQGVLPLLRLRRRRRRLQVSRAAREGRVPGRGEAAGAAVRHAAAGARSRATSSAPSAAERETLLKIHEAAAAWFRAAARLARPARACGSRSPTAASPTATGDGAGLGFAPPARDGLKQALLDAGLLAGAAPARRVCWSSARTASVIDRFRNRLMIPICRDTGSVIAFGGRALDADQQPKYLNSPETPIYSKGRTLYGLNLSKAAIRQGGFAVLVEGYFDFAQVYQAGVPAGGGVVRHGADAAAGAAAAAVHRQGRAELRPGRGRPGRHGQIVRNAGGRRV